MLHLNSSINSHPSYLLSLTAYLNSWTNSSIIVPSCSSSSSPLLNSCFNSVRNSSAVSYFRFPPSKSFKMFSFDISANPPYTYNSIYWTCSSTTSLLILILMYNLHVVMNPETFLELLSNTCSFATSVFNLMLDLTTVLPCIAIST